MKKLLLVFTMCVLSIQAQDDKTIVKKLEKGENVPFSIIDEVPIFPGCGVYSDREKKKHCLNLKMRKHVQRHFDISIIKCLEKREVLNKKTGEKEKQCYSPLEPGKKRIYIQFKIGKTGEIEDLKVDAPHPKLKEEGIRVAKKLPVMIPGKEKGEPVRVGYTLPITFTIK